MKLQPNISKTIFHSFLFAIGGSPTIAMWLIQQQNHDQTMFITIFMSLSALIACILIPIVFIQNSFLLWKRNSVIVEDKIKPLSLVYLGLNILCLIFWIFFSGLLNKIFT